MKISLLLFSGFLFFVQQVIPTVSYAQSNLDSSNGMIKGDFFSDTNSLLDQDSSDLETGFENKFNNIFNTVKKAEQSSKNTDLGPFGRYLLGKHLAARAVAAYKVSKDNDEKTNYLTNITSSLLAVSRNPDSYKDPVIILLEEPNLINAFAAPGGFIFITTGMLGFIQNEDELAFVLAHEIAHIELDHGLNAIKQNEGSKIFDDATDEASETFFRSFKNFAENGYSETIEAEADLRGAEIASSLGYDVSQGIQVIKRLEQVLGRTHGTGYPKNRIKRLENNFDKSEVKKESVELRKKRYSNKILR